MASGAGSPLDSHLPETLARESRFQLLTRLGFAARGLLYILIAFLAIATGRTEDLTGALEYVGDGTGRAMLIAIAVGLTAYGLWRLSDVVFGTEHPGNEWKNYGQRAISGGIGIIYLYLSYKAVRVLLAGSADEASASEQADTVLDLPGGTVALFCIALGFVVGAGSQFYKTVRCRFMRRLREGAGQKPWIKLMGRLGYAARGVIFLVLAWLIFRAAANHSGSEAGDLEQALDVLRGPLLTPMAAGLLLFGLFSLVEARFRQIHQPPVDGMRHKVAEKIAPPTPGK